VTSDADLSTRWLSPEQRQVWLDMVRVLTRLPASLDAQLERDAGMNFYEYHVLSMLSETEQRTLSVSRLAELTSSSVTRLSNVAKRLEARGLLARVTDPADRRVTLATLTDAGLAAVTAAAPRHVTIVRRLIVDAVTPAQLRQLQAIQQRILAELDPGAVTRPEWLDPEPAP